MSEKDQSSFNENNEVFSGKSKTSSTEKESLFFGNCAAISPDNQQIVTFNPRNSEFNLYDIDNLTSSKSFKIPEPAVYDKRLCWSIAISNRVDVDKDERLIALSYSDGKPNDQYNHDEKDLGSSSKVNNQYVDEEKGLESGSDKVNINEGQTWVISTTDIRDIRTSLESIGGVTNIGEKRTSLESIGGATDIKEIRTSLELKSGGVIRFLNSDDDYSDQPLKNKIVIILVNESGILKKTMNMNRKGARGGTKRNLIFSKNEQFELPERLLLCLSRDTWQNSLKRLHKSIIKNHFMVHSFENRQQIIEMYSLITGDLEMLFIRYESSIAPDIIRSSPIFSISQNEKILAFCQGTTSITLYSMENGLEIATKRLEGQGGIYKIIAINFIDDDNKLLIVLEKKDRQGKNSKRQIIVVWDLFTTFENSIRQIDYPDPLKMHLKHRLMNSHGNMFAVRDSGDSGDSEEVISILDRDKVKSILNILNPPKKEKTSPGITPSDYILDGNLGDQISIDKVEPWHPSKNYFQMSVFLDSTKRTKLIISPNTIQVWKYRSNNNEKLDENDRVLEYIWAHKNKINNVQELEVREREFVLKSLVLPTPTKCSPSKIITIHWPNNVNVLEGACRSLYVLGEKKRANSVISLESVNQIESLIENYYADNTKEYNNYGWMFTVSEAIPSLYDAKLSELVQYLFKKPCFGTTEAYTPPLNINPIEQKRGDNATVIHSLLVKPGLPLKFNYTLWLNPFTRLYYSFQSASDRKVCMVPLPNFTVYPKDSQDQDPKDLKDFKKYFLIFFSLFRILLWPRRKVINDTKQMSPFLRIIHEEIDDEIYRTPAFMAVLDFKWAAARLYCIRYILVGWYLIVTEVLQIKRGGRKYVKISNMVDQISVILPLLNYIAAILYDHQVLIFHKSAYNTFLAFTTLILWLELDDSSLSIPTYKINDTSNSDLYSNLTIYQDIDKSSWLDNYYSNPYLSVIAIFFWTNGRWDQLDQWDSYAVCAMSILGSIILVLIFQNMLIAFMNGEFERAHKEGRTAAYKHRAEIVADYESLEKIFFSKRGNPRDIYYITDPDMIDTWLTETEKDEKRELHYSKKNQDRGSSSVTDSDSIESSPTKNIDTISFIDEEIFLSSKSKNKLQTNSKSNRKLSKNVGHNDEVLDPILN
ncbi:7195_t:CDS:10, partial [Diversispora eburnea]